ncbi:AAA family ATPase [Streptomyces sp. NPDC002769]|uniref:ATP-dependent nuclease n=1 Tax=Streptomyces sp. NPDC002769 TaxID=3154542 RepID=UPI00332C3549
MKISRLRIRNWKSISDTDEMKLDAINVLLGRNNSGKSAFLHALHLLQDGSDVNGSNVRINEDLASIAVTFSSDDTPSDVARHLNKRNVPLTGSLGVRIALTAAASNNYQCEITGLNVYGQPPFESREPQNLFYTYFSRRKVPAFNRNVDRYSTINVATDLRNLVAKVNRLASADYVGFDEYTRLCLDVLGFRIGTYASEGGSQAGVSIGRHDHIPIEAMGEGVSSLLGLITDLCMAERNIFLIEEPENDVHPESLKSLLKVIVEKSRNNQFIVTTHSNIVARYLGAAPDSKMFSVDSAYAPGAVPTSLIREIESTPEARMDVLRGLGYELSDFDLWDAWLILEESSAETVITNLIKWFVPRLARVRTLSANGVSKAIPVFEDFRRLFLFAHLEGQYRGRAWVVLDGDEPGKEVIEKLRATYKDWPEQNFQTWQHEDFEHYYPDRFRDQAAGVLALPHDKKRHAKNALTRTIKTWIKENPEVAKSEFEQSAAEIITFLRNVDKNLFG